MRDRWRRGDVVQLEMMGFGVPFMALPVRVVGDSPGMTALFFQDGTAYRQLVQEDGSFVPRVMTAEVFGALTTRYVRMTQPGRSVFALVPDGRAYAIHLSWTTPEWTFRRWYVNLQTPLERIAAGFRSVDQFLDIVVRPGLTWSWNDENELAEAVEIGRLSQRDADAIRSEGERVVDDIEHRRWPFDGSMTSWRPDPAWQVPATLDARTREER